MPLFFAVTKVNNNDELAVGRKVGRAGVAWLMTKQEHSGIPLQD